MSKYEELKKSLSFAEEFADFSETSYIGDAVAEIADSNTSIYYSDIMDFIRSNPYALADVVDEGLYDPAHDYDLYKHGQAAEYMTIEREIYDDLDNYILFAALDYAKNIGAPWYDDIEEDIAAAVAGLDNNDQFSDIYDAVNNLFEEKDEKAAAGVA